MILARLDSDGPVRLKRNIVANYIGRVYGIGAIYLFVPFYVKLLGVESYGLIAFYAVILAFTALADVGLSTTFSREAATTNDKHRLLDLLTTIERILFLTTGFLAVMLFTFADWVAAHWLNTGEGLDTVTVGRCVRLMALTLPVQLLISLYSAGLLGLQRQVLANGLQALYTTVRSGIVIVPLFLLPEPWVFFAWHLAATCIFALITRMALVGAIGFPRLKAGRFVPRKMAPLLAYASGMFIITIISSINTQLDKLVVSKLFSVQDFGYYTLAGALSQLPVAATSPIAIALFPTIAALIANQRSRESHILYEKYTFVIALLASLGAIGLALFAGDVFTLWLAGKSMSADILEVVAYLSLGSLFLCLQLGPYYLSLANNDNWIIARLATVTLFLSIPLIYIGASRFGLRGAAGPWLILNFLNFVILSFAINHRYYLASHLAWLIKYVILPVSIGAVSMGLARWLSVYFALDPFAACILAFCAATLTITIVWWSAHYLPFAELNES